MFGAQLGGAPPPNLWQADVAGGQRPAPPPIAPLASLPSAPLPPSASTESVSSAWRHIKDVVATIGKEHDLMERLANVAREATYQFHPQGVSRSRAFNASMIAYGCWDRIALLPIAPMPQLSALAASAAASMRISNLRAPPCALWPFTHSCTHTALDGAAACTIRVVSATHCSLPML